MRNPQKLCAAIIAVALVLFFLTACGQSKKAVVFTEKANNRYASIVWDEKEYVPFCAITSPKDIGAYIGHMEGDKDLKVYDYKDYSNEEWIIQSGYGCSMLYKETNTSNIPNGLISEYEWNNQLSNSVIG